MHSELYLDARTLPELEPVLKQLPKISVDHLGMNRDGLPHLLRLVERGARVKATGFGRLDFDPVPVIKAVAAASPDALMFGSDMPSTRAKRPFQPTDIDILADALGEPLARKALHDNAVAFYRAS
jgi:predicted TIM-barrel fold metal-dependent hydrolase